MKTIYLDYNATTPIDKEVRKAMLPFLDEYFGNPSSTHEYGIKTKLAVLEARKSIAALINCAPDEVIFTSGGSESNNYAIKGIAYSNRNNGDHIITSKVEHPAVIEVCRYLESDGFDVTYLDVDEYGMVNANDVENAIRPTTILITIMHANNEVGTIQPIEEIGNIAKKHQVYFHSDASQSVGKLSVNVKEMKVDLLSVAGHKLYAPKGIGALYCKRGVELQKLIHGADHEMNKRAGTENVLEIVGLGKACEIAARDMLKNQTNMQQHRNLLESKLLSAFPDAKVNGHPEKRLVNTLSISFPNIEANTLLAELTGVAASAGAACHTDSIDVSSVLQAMAIPESFAMGTLRFSTGKHSTKDEMEQAAKMIIETVNKLKGKDNYPEFIPLGGEYKLTQYTHGLGCACKIRPQYLEMVLQDFPVVSDPKVLVSLDSADDAAVYQISADTALIQTVDFFTPVVDDPMEFGMIAAANALSDIYAMGGKPLFALNIVGFPDQRLPVEVLKDILRGANEKAKEAGMHILGGHTVEDTEPKFGMAVTGTAHPDKIISNAGARPGDVLILTKPIGTGIITTAIKQGLAGEDARIEATKSMMELNKIAAEAMSEFEVHACTDVTGFGLLGHLREMTKASKVNAEIDSNKIPLLPAVEDLAAANAIPGGTKNNLAYVQQSVNWSDGISDILKYIYCDAQTSGGLLIALPESDASRLLVRLHKDGIDKAKLIGKFTIEGKGVISVF